MSSFEARRRPALKTERHELVQQLQAENKRRRAKMPRFHGQRLGARMLTGMGVAGDFFHRRLNTTTLSPLRYEAYARNIRAHNRRRGAVAMSWGVLGLALLAEGVSFTTNQEACSEERVLRPLNEPGNLTRLAETVPHSGTPLAVVERVIFIDNATKFGKAPGTDGPDPNRAFVDQFYVPTECESPIDIPPDIISPIAFP